MSNTIEFQSKVGPDGTLNVSVPLGASEAGTEVVITIRPASNASTPDSNQNWHEFVEATYGSCAGLGIERAEQGKFETREEIE